RRDMVKDAKRARRYNVEAYNTLIYYTLVNSNCTLCLSTPPGRASPGAPDRGLDAAPLPPFRWRVSPAPVEVATSNPSPSRISRTLRTCWALDSASLPLPIHRLSARPPRTFPPIDPPFA